MRPFPSVALALMLVSASLAAASSQRIWDFAPFSRIRRSPAEKGAPANGHPLKVDSGALAQALGDLRLVVKSGDEPLFAPAEAAVLARALADALAQVQPGEDLELVSTSNRGPGFFNATLGVTARAFARDGRLNLIVRDARLDFLYQYGLESRMPELSYGSRNAAGTAALKAPGAELRRPDWVILPAAALAPATRPEPVPAGPVPAPAAAAPPVPRAPSQSPGVEERLRDLKRFREQGLITEEEYAQRKQELLDQFIRSASPAG